MVLYEVYKNIFLPLSYSQTENVSFSEKLGMSFPKE